MIIRQKTSASGSNNFDNSEIAYWCTSRSLVRYTRHNGLRPVPWPWGTEQTWPVTPVQAPFVRGRSAVFWGLYQTGAMATALSLAVVVTRYWSPDPPLDWSNLVRAYYVPFSRTLTSWTFWTLPKTGLNVCSKSDITMDYCSDSILWDLLPCT